LADQQLKFKGMRLVKVKGQGRIKTRLIEVLNKIGVELNSYHGGSLNGKDIKKIMNNASHVFDQVAVIFKEGKRPDCIMTDVDIDALCLNFREVFVLWDGAYLLARTVNPMEQDTNNYL
jgi:hypothetical protein